LIGLGDELAALAQHPKRYPVLLVETRRIGQETRRLLYQRSFAADCLMHV
jgi:actin-related protein